MPKKVAEGSIGVGERADDRMQLIRWLIGRLDDIIGLIVDRHRAVIHLRQLKRAMQCVIDKVPFVVSTEQEKIRELFYSDCAEDATEAWSWLWTEWLGRLYKPCMSDYRPCPIDLIPLYIPDLTREAQKSEFYREISWPKLKQIVPVVWEKSKPTDKPRSEIQFPFWQVWEDLAPAVSFAGVSECMPNVPGARLMNLVEYYVLVHFSLDILGDFPQNEIIRIDNLYGLEEQQRRGMRVFWDGEAKQVVAGYATGVERKIGFVISQHVLG